MNRRERRAAEKQRSQAAGGAAAPAEAARLFVEAVRQHQQGRVLDAEALCRAVLARDGSHAGALHLLGVTAMQRGFSLKRRSAISAAAAQIRPDIAIGQHSLGKALAAAGRPDAAATAFEQAVALQPDFAEARKDLGVVLAGQGRFREASGSFAEALRLVPELAENFAGTVATLLSVNPALRDGVAAAAAAWPKLLPIEELLGAPGLAAIAGDAMLLAVLKATTTVRDVALERFPGPRCARQCSSASPIGRAIAMTTRSDSAVRWRGSASTTNMFLRRALTRPIARSSSGYCWSRRCKRARPSRRSVSPRWQAMGRWPRCRTRYGCSSEPGPPLWTNC